MQQPHRKNTYQTIFDFNIVSFKHDAFWLKILINLEKNFILFLIF